MSQNAYKIGYIFFNGLWESLKEDFNYELSQNVVFSRKQPDIDEPVWKEWLGLQWDEIKESNAVVEVRNITENPEILDEENKMIDKECRKIWVSLMLSGALRLDKAFFLTGSEIDGQVKIREFFKFDRWFNTNEYSEKMNDTHVDFWKKLYCSLKCIYSKDDDYVRLKRGLNCFLKGCSEEQINFRLPFHVRALEALIKPEKGKTEKQFVSRGSNFWNLCESNKYFDENVQTALKEIYEIRCDFDHMHGMKAKLEENKFLRCYQCEELCRKAYQKLLLDDALLHNFKEDAQIDDLWKDNILNKCMK